MTLIIAVVVVADLAAKATVATLIGPGHRVGPLVPITNPRFMLGVAGTQTLAMVALMTLGVAVAATLATRLMDKGRIRPAAAGLALGGALANTLDRLLHGPVQDFLLIGHVVLNLADIAVVVGLAAAATTLARTARRPRR